MKNKVVIWGTNAQQEKVLIALELQEEVNKVQTYVFPKSVCTDEFINSLETTWRESKSEVAFPEGHTAIERELSVADGLLPEGFKADKPEILNRVQTEWQVVVLSSKLHRAYQTELAEFKEKVSALTKYDKDIFQGLRTFWDKVTEQSRDRNLFRRHADSLRDDINALFNDLKKLKDTVDAEFAEVSQKVYDELNNKLTEVEARIEKGTVKMGLIMDELGAIQTQYKGARMTNVHRNELWERINGAYKAAKERRFGAGATEGSVVERNNRRIDGLRDAANRMADAIKRDEQELEFQRKKVKDTDGQLEQQIRQAKIKLVEERLASKRERMADIEKTIKDVERQSKSHHEREDKRQRFDAAKESAKNEIAAITTRGAANMGENVPATQSMMDVLANVLGESLEDVVDTVKAVAEVATEKAQIAIATAVEKANDFVDAMQKDDEAPAAEPTTEAVAEAPAEVAEAVVAEAPVEDAVTEAPAEDAVAEAPAADAPADAPADDTPAKDDEEKA
jgi:hypothetical protein